MACSLPSAWDLGRFLPRFSPDVWLLAPTARRAADVDGAAPVEEIALGSALAAAEAPFERVIIAIGATCV